MLLLCRYYTLCLNCYLLLHYSCTCIPVGSLGWAKRLKIPSVILHGPRSGEFFTERSNILCGLALKSLMVLVALGFGKSADVTCTVIVPLFTN